MTGFGELPGWGMQEMLEVWFALMSLKPPPPSSYAVLKHLFHLAFPELYLFIFQKAPVIVRKCFPKFFELFSQ